MTADPDIIITADDLGISPGTNHAVREAHLNGCVTHTSLMAGGAFREDAVANVIRNCPELVVGAHLSLTCGSPLTDFPARTPDGTFSDGFSGIFQKSLQGDGAFLAAVEGEFRAQLDWIRSQGIPLGHIDGHHHVHMIPAIFRIVKSLALEAGVPRIRIPDESFGLSLGVARSSSFLRNAGMVKYLLMKLLARQNGERSDRKFFSLLFTGGVSKKMIRRALDSGRRMEVTVHPGLPEMDEGVRFHDEEQRRYRLSARRKMEFEACLEG